MEFFPIKYFQSIWTARLIFQGRKQLSWFQLIFMFVFLNALLLGSYTIAFSQLTTYPYERVVSMGLQSITEETAPLFQQGKVEQGEYQGVASFKEISEGFVAILPSEELKQHILSSGKRGVILTERQLIFSYPNEKSLTMQLKKDYDDLSQLKTVDEVKGFLSQQWFLSNKESVFAILITVQAFMLYSGSIFLIFVGGIVLMLTKKSKLFSIASYKEAVNLLLNCYGLPTLLALVANVVTQDQFVVTNIQMFGTVLVIVYVFYKTHFQDDEKIS